MRRLVLLLAAVAHLAKATALLPARNLRTEYLDSPLGIDTPKPRFSWQLECESTQRGASQSAYEIAVSEATNDEKIAPKDPILWLGKENSTQTINIPYAGPPLKSVQIYMWRVRWWSKEDTSTPSEWSSWATFGTALNDSDWIADWIGRPHVNASQRPLQIRADFLLPSDVTQALIYVAGLGYYQLYLNGRRVDSHALGSFTVFQKRILYDTFAVTSFLRKGDSNAIGVRLAPGPWGQFYDGPLMLRLELHAKLVDGSTVKLVSHSGNAPVRGADVKGWWRIDDDPCTQAAFYDGEHYDARLEQDGWNAPNFAAATRWQDAAEVSPEGVGRLHPSNLKPIRKFEEIKAVRLTEPVPGVYVFDLGQNFAGVEILRVRGPAGATVTIYKGELLFDNGTVHNQLRVNMTTVYTLRGGDDVEVYEPDFVYYGFQYAQVTGFPGKPTLDSLSGRFVHSDLNATGDIEFEGDSAEASILRGIQHCVKWSALSNLMSIPTDCPNREKRGWMGDGQVSSSNAAWNFDMAAFYESWVRSMRDQQEIYASVEEIAGMVTDIVPDPARPTPKAFTDATWSSAYLIVPLLVYRHYGDVALISELYEGFRDYVVYLDRLAQENSSVPGGLLTKHKYGDWCNTYPRETREIPITGPISASFFQITVYEIFSRFARILNRSDDAVKYAQMAEKLKPIFHEFYYNKTTAGYQDGSQTPNVLALSLDGAIPRETLQDVVETFLHDVTQEHNYHLTTGAVGTKFLLQTLTLVNRSDLAFALATQTTEPSWGWWVTQNATTLWENWSGVADLTHPPPPTHNHIFLGSHWPWLYETFVGIDQADDSTAFEHIVIRPIHATIPLETWKTICSGDVRIFKISGVNASYDSIRGKISVAWSHANEGNVLFSLAVTIPMNSDAEVWVPTQNYCGKIPSPTQVVVTESGHEIWSDGKLEPIKGVLSGSYNSEYQAVVLQIVSGSYVFAYSLMSL